MEEKINLNHQDINSFLDLVEKVFFNVADLKEKNLQRKIKVALLSGCTMILMYSYFGLKESIPYILATDKNGTIFEIMLIVLLVAIWIIILKIGFIIIEIIRTNTVVEREQRVITKILDTGKVYGQSNFPSILSEGLYYMRFNRAILQVFTSVESI